MTQLLVAEKVKSRMNAQMIAPTVRGLEKERDLPRMLRILEEECRKCTPLTPLQCISSCKTWKLKNELRRLRKAIENPEFTKDLMNVLKNETRLQILMTIAKGHYSLHKIQQELRKAGHSFSQEIIGKGYLDPLLEVGLAVEAQGGQYYATTFGVRLTELIEGSSDAVNFLPANSECYEETVLKTLLSGPKTFEDIKGNVSERNVSRILRRLKKVDLLKTPTERDYVFFFRSKRDPAKEKFSSTESKVYSEVPDDGISAQKLTKKTGLTVRATYKYIRRLKGKKMVFTRRMPKAYCLTAKGEKLALLLQELHSLVEETLCSSAQVFKGNETVTPRVSCLS